MIYVLQVLGGKEERTRDLIAKLVNPEICRECFVPYCEVSQCHHGAWQTSKKIMFPGYLFIETGDVKTLAVELGKVPSLTKLLGNSEKFVPLSKQEVNLIERFTNGGHVMEKSTGVIEGDEVKVFEGPLQGLEGLVKKIDRHKRLAFLEIQMFGRTLTVKAALEIVTKR